MRSLITAYRTRHNGNGRSVLLGHAFVDGGFPSDSERPLSIGGVDTVSVNHFDGFSYVALGHLHQPQAFSRSRVRYAGSLMRYSFNEAAQRKSVSVVEIDRDGDVSLEEIEFTPRREVRRISGYLEDLLKNPGDYGPRDDYLMADLLDESALYDPLGRLREVFPNLLHLERSRLLAREERKRSMSDIAGKGDVELFDDFMLEMTGKRMTEEQTEAFVSVAEEVHRSEREVV
jgi:exonuclease SbcD